MANILNDFFMSRFNSVKLLSCFNLPGAKPSDLPLDYFDTIPEEVSILIRSLNLTQLHDLMRYQFGCCAHL